MVLGHGYTYFWGPGRIFRCLLPSPIPKDGAMGGSVGPHDSFVPGFRVLASCRTLWLLIRVHASLLWWPLSSGAIRFKNGKLLSEQIAVFGMRRIPWNAELRKTNRSSNKDGKPRSIGFTLPTRPFEECHWGRGL